MEIDFRFMMGELDKEVVRLREEVRAKNPDINPLGPDYPDIFSVMKNDPRFRRARIKLPET